jgi:hypothetical protein
MNIDERLIINCKQALFDARADLEKAQKILDALFAENAADDRKIDTDEKTEMQENPEPTPEPNPAQFVPESPPMSEEARKNV